jgi:hypothetical protein
VNRSCDSLAPEILCAVIVVMCPRWTQAHHSYAMLDITHVSQVSGTVRTLEWTNPHVWLWLSAVSQAGNAAERDGPDYKRRCRICRMPPEKGTLRPQFRCCAHCAAPVDFFLGGM